MVSKTAVPVLVAGMLLTGISNSMFNKYQDMQCVQRCDDPNPSKHVDFSQPVWQTATMFLGELLCLVPVVLMYLYKRIASARRRRQRWTDMFRSTSKSTSMQYSPIAQQDNLDSPIATPRSSININHHDENDMHTATNGTVAQTVPNGSGEERQRLLRRSQSHDAATAQQPAEQSDGEQMSTAAASLFFMPALCDICGTTLMNVGLLFTPVSVYQMTRGALVLWVGVFSVIFLRRSLYLYQWLCLALVVLGVCIVGLSSTMLSPDSGASLSSSPHALGLAPEAGAHANDSPSLSHGGGDEELPQAVGALLGVVLILFAQIFTASQFVLEEKIMGRYSVEPLVAVGVEGLFGLCTTLAAQVLLHFTYGRTPDGRGGYFDMRAGWQQITQTPAVLYASFAIAISIALFNFFGLSVTRNISATARSTIDTCRTLGIWIASLTLGWEVFRPMSGGLQIVGFALLCYATLVFNAVVKPPRFLRPPPSRRARSRSRSRGNRSQSRTRSHLRRSNTAPDIHQSVHSATAQDVEASVESLASPAHRTID